MKVNEIFQSIQGEGRFTGSPVLFIRLSGCTRKCKWCDTSYHTKSVEMSVSDIVKKIFDSELDVVVWTGGEPALQIKEIEKVIKLTENNFYHHLETNGDIKINETEFDYICYSPKDLTTAKKLDININNDIKIVTDLKTVGLDLIPYATMLMPLTTYNNKKDKKIEQDVWNYCVENNIKFCLRQHVHVWGNKKGI